MAANGRSIIIEACVFDTIATFRGRIRQASKICCGPNQDFESSRSTNTCVEENGAATYEHPDERRQLSHGTVPRTPS